MTRFRIALTLLLAGGAVAAAQDAELPDGDGKRILVASCTSCHDLRDVTKLRGFYTRDQWRDVVKTMVEYGAKLQPGDEDVLVEYLTQHLGKQRVAGSW